MGKIERRKEISDFSKNLHALIASAPDGYAKRDIKRMIYSLRQRYSLTFEQKQIRILELLESGLTTYQELLDETRFGEKQLSRSLEKLLLDKKIRLVKIRRTSGAGRPQICYFLAQYDN